MIDTNPDYARLAKYLTKTRKSLIDACNELDIDIDYIDDTLLQEKIDQCSHCNIWSRQLIADLDDNLVCPLCAQLAGL
jgi:hypothetical protein